MNTKSSLYIIVRLATLALALTCRQIPAANFHVATAQGLQNALTTAAHNGASNNIYLTNGYYAGNFDYNSSGGNNLTLLAEPGVTNSDITIDGEGVGNGLSISTSSSASQTIAIQGIGFAATFNDHGYSGLLVQAATNCSISLSGCRFFNINTYSDAVDAIGLTVMSGLNVTLNSCTVTGAVTEGAEIGIAGVGGPRGNITVQNCAFMQPGTGMEIFTGTSVVISNNIFSGAVVPNADGIAVAMNFGSFGGGDTVNLFNNTFNGNGYGADIVSASAVTLIGNAFTSNANCSLTLAGDQSLTLVSNIFIGNVSGTVGYGGAVTVFDDLYDVNAFVNISIINNKFVSNVANFYNSLNGNSGTGFGGGLQVDVGDATVTVEANTFEGNMAGGDGGAAQITAPTVTFSDNLVARNTQTNGSSAGGGVWVDASSELFFINNTITGNTSGGGGGGVAFQITNLVAVLNVYNNIIWGNSGDPEADVWLAGTGEERIFSFNDANDIFGVWDLFQNNLTVDPHFVNAADGNYHLLGSSSCIDAGTNGVPSLPLTDLDGNPRVVGDNVDMGCYEFRSAGISATIMPSSTNGFLLQWSSIAGVNYAVQKSTNLSGGFFDVTPTLPATPPLNTYTDVPTPGTPAAFYRIRSW